MKVVIDSYALLGAIGEHPTAFAGIDEQVRKQASSLLTAQLKHKSLTLSLYRSIVCAIGKEAFELFLDTADGKLLKALTKKLDPNAPVAKSDDGDALRLHLTDLGSGHIEPMPKVAKARSARKRAGKAASTAAAGGSDVPHAIATKPPGRR